MTTTKRREAVKTKFEKATKGAKKKRLIVPMPKRAPRGELTEHEF